MGQILKLNGLEDGGLFTSSMLEEYNSLKTNASKRAYVLNVIRAGYSVDQMGLGPIVALLEENDGEKFLAMTKRERLQRLLTLISAVLGESVQTPAVQPVQAPPAQEAAPQPDAQPASPPAAEEPQPAPAVKEPASEDDRPLVIHNDDDNSTRRVENGPRAVIPASASKLQRHRPNKTS
ncbi:hypothetical protein Q9R34_19240 [Enterobacter sp. BRE11]|nr:hypothetical protein [Enterobacter sp. BRE11]